MKPETTEVLNFVTMSISEMRKLMKCCDRKALLNLVLDILYYA